MINHKNSNLENNFDDSAPIKSMANSKISADLENVKKCRKKCLF